MRMDIHEKDIFKKNKAEAWYDLRLAVRFLLTCAFVHPPQ